MSLRRPTSSASAPSELGALHQTGHAAARERRAGILRHGAQHLPAAAVDQHVGNRLRDARAPGDREQMLLALRLGDADQVVVGQSFGERENGSRDLDAVLVRQASHQLGRRERVGGQPSAQSGTRPGADLFDQPADDVIEQLDLGSVQVLGIFHEQIGHPAQGLDALRARSRLHHAFQLLEQQLAFAHGLDTPRFASGASEGPIRTVSGMHQARQPGIIS